MNSTQRKTRKLVEFELNPARCVSCQHFTPPQYGVPGGAAYRHPVCGEFEFAVRPHSICNNWLGKKGLGRGEDHEAATAQ